MKMTRISGRRRRLFILAAALLETLPLWLNGYRGPGDVVVRCRKGHLYTTIWVPGVSLKSIRFAWWRLQRCPVGGHWSIVTPVKESTLGKGERRAAIEHRDIRIP